MTKMTTFLLTVVLSTFPVWADLNDLKDEVKKEESQSDPPQEPTTVNSGNQTSSNDPTGNFVATVLMYAWAADNLWTTFEDYPYAGDAEGFVLWPKVIDTDTASNSALPLTDAGGRNGYWTVSVTGFGLDGLGIGSWVALDGQAYRFFGPLVETWTLYDGTQMLGGYRLGGTFSLVQADPANIAFYGQLNGWYGHLERQGAALGLRLRTYPLRSLVVEGRIGVQAFEGFSVIEAEIQLGWMLGRYEVFAGARRWTLSETASYTGVSGGLRVWL